MRTARRFELVVATSGLVLAAVVGLVATNVGSPYPGFSPRPTTACSRWRQTLGRSASPPGDRIVAVDGGSPLDLVRRVRQSGARSG